MLTVSYRKQMVCLALTLLAAGLVHADSLRIDRYRVVDTTAAIEEVAAVPKLEPLRFADELRTTKAAVDSVLQRYGYRWAPFVTLPIASLDVLFGELPAQHRQLAAMKLRRALQTLLCPHIRPVLDPVQRRVSLEPVDPNDNSGACHAVR